MKVIYKPKGRAGEYAKLALNIYSSCEHGCKYCYVPKILRRKKEEFHTNIKVRDNILSLAEEDAYKLLKEGCKDRILLCFTCDPYQPLERKLGITRKILKILNNYNLNFQILTKGGLDSARDFDLYKKEDEFATTLTFASKEHSKLYEPGAPDPASRIASLIEAKKYGIKTWVSLEPIINPNQTLKLIDMTYRYVDKYKIGKINYDPITEKKINWERVVEEISLKLKGLNKEFYIKEDFSKWLIISS